MYITQTPNSFVSHFTKPFFLKWNLNPTSSCLWLLCTSQHLLHDQRTRPCHWLWLIKTVTMSFYKSTAGLSEHNMTTKIVLHCPSENHISHNFSKNMFTEHSIVWAIKTTPYMSLNVSPFIKQSKMSESETGSNVYFVS